MKTATMTVKRSGGGRQKRGWWKTVTGVDRQQKGAYRFLGDWVQEGDQTLPAGTLLMECQYRGNKANRQALISLHWIDSNGKIIVNGPFDLRADLSKLCDSCESYLNNGKPARVNPNSNSNGTSKPVALPRADQVPLKTTPKAAQSVASAVMGSNTGVATDVFRNGAFVFWNNRLHSPAMDPADVVLMAEAAGLPASIVPEYAGDRQVLSRVIDGNASKLKRKGWVLSAIKRANNYLCMTIHQTNKDVDAKVTDLPQVGTIEWWAEQPDPDNKVHSDHTVGALLDQEYQQLKGKIVGQDWTSTLVNYLVDECFAVGYRQDGRVYWVPPVGLQKVKELQSWIKSVGVNIAIAEIDAEVQDSVQEVVRESLFDQLENLKSEIENFNGRQKPSTYSDRIDQLHTLRKRAIVFTETLADLKDESAELLANIDSMDSHVENMLEERKQIRVKRDGTIEYL
jgi:hypothetical protein